MSDFREGYLYPHELHGTKIKEYGPGVCVECGGKVSKYTEPQPITKDRLCNRHWRYPEGYYQSGAGRAVREKKVA